MALARATFAAGCFWGVEDAFRAVRGVVATGVGYCGGHTVEPSYADVCRGGTGHAETVQVEFDPDLVSYDDLLTVFWGCHDPTQRNRQGPDIGSQYRSAIFCHDSEQQRAARASLLAESRSGRHHGRIVTRIEPLKTFWPAEEEHQQYMEKQLAGSLGLNRP